MANGEFEFNTSNRYIIGKIVWSSAANVTANASTVTTILYYKKSSESTSTTYGTFNGNININGTIKTINKRITLNCNDTYQEISRMTVPNVTHNSDGTKSITISASGGISGTTFSNSNGNRTVILDTIPRESRISNFNDFVVGENIKIGITKYSKEFIDTLTIKCGNITIKTINNYISNSNISFSENELNKIYEIMKLVTIIDFTTTITTKAGNKIIGSNSKTVKGSLKECNPKFITNNISYYDNNIKTVEVTEDDQFIVQSLSELVVNIKAAVPQKGAGISLYDVNVNGVRKTMTTSGRLNFGKVNSSQNVQIECTVTDSRGNKTTAKKTIKILEWSLPKAEIILERLNNYEDTTYLTVKSNYSSVNNKNAIQIKYMYSVNNAFEATKNNIIVGDAVGLRNMTPSGDSSIICEITESEIKKITKNSEVIRFSNRNYIEEKIDEDYIDIIAYYEPNSLNQYTTEYLLVRYDKKTQKIISNDSLPGYYLNSDIVQSINKKAISYKYLYLKSIPNYQTIENNEKIEKSCAKDRIWYFKILIKDKFGQTIYNLILQKGRPILYIDILNLGVGINCFPKGKGLWTDEEWEDIELEKGFAGVLDCYTPQYKKSGDLLYFRGCVWKQNGTFTTNSEKIGKIDYNLDKRVILGNLGKRIDIDKLGNINVKKTTTDDQFVSLDGLTIFLK